MSCPKNNLALTLSEIPFKPFLKETKESPLESHKRKYNLEFEGNEAKLAYEEIISSTNKKSLLMQQKHSTRKKCDDTTKKPTKNLNANTTTNIINNVNLLFKAIESNDIKFITEHFNFENVNIVDQFGWTPLMSAAYLGSTEIVNILIKLGANTNLKEKSGLTAIDLAIKQKNLNIVHLIKQKSNQIKQSKINTNNLKILEKIKQDKVVTDRKGFYCQLCKTFFLESSKEKHETSTLHIFNSKPKVDNTFYGIPKQNKGYQMLLNDGWEEGGLGPSGEGQKYPVKTILKRDRKGLGQSPKDIPRITHFDAKDIRAVTFLRKSKRKVFNKKDRMKQLSKEMRHTKALREALS